MRRSAGLKRLPLRGRAGEDWNERAGRLFSEFRRPAQGMVRRAFRGAFSAEEIDDIYAGAWAGTLRALADRAERLGDDEIRSYLLTAVANQAGKELRRRKRKPTAPLELVGGIADHAETPEELADGRERSRIARDLLASLPPRRRAVMLLRYGWGLEPKQVCALIEGLSPRAYRKEVTRGVAELSERMRALERGEWCAEREPLLRALVSGLASADQERQARAHLAHCRECSRFVARLGGHLQDLGGPAAAGAVDGIDGHLSLADRALDLGERFRDAAAGALGRGTPAEAEQAGAAVAAAGGARGAGVAGAGVLAKLAGLGTAGKLAVACIGGGVAATACVAAGVAPLGLGGERESVADRRAALEPARKADPAVAVAAPADPQPGAGEQAPAGEQGGPADPPAPEPEPEPAPTPEPEPALAEGTPAVEREFGVEAAVPAPAPASVPAAPASSSAGSSGSGGGGSAVAQEFGP